MQSERKRDFYDGGHANLKFLKFRIPRNNIFSYGYKEYFYASHN